MLKTLEKWDHVISLLQSIQAEIKLLNVAKHNLTIEAEPKEFVYVLFRGAEIYLLHKALIDAGGASHENYKSLVKKTES